MIFAKKSSGDSRVRTAAAFLFVLVVLACGGTTGGNGGAGNGVAGDAGAGRAGDASAPPLDGLNPEDSCAVTTRTACGPPQHVATASAVIAAAMANGYVPVDRELQKRTGIALGDDLIADTDLDVPLSSFPLPCPSCNAPLLKTTSETGQEVPGVRCAEDGGCSVMVITKDTRFRIVATLARITDYPGGPPQFFIEIEEPCADACSDGNVLCPSSHICVTPGEAYCRYCEPTNYDLCVCRNDDCTTRAGAKCRYFDPPTSSYSSEGICTGNGCRLP